LYDEEESCLKPLHASPHRYLHRTEAAVLPVIVLGVVLTIAGNYLPYIAGETVYWMFE
jgi:hypothetical protein